MLFTWTTQRLIRRPNRWMMMHHRWFLCAAFFFLLLERVGGASGARSSETAAAAAAFLGSTRSADRPFRRRRNWQLLSRSVGRPPVLPSRPCDDEGAPASASSKAARPAGQGEASETPPSAVTGVRLNKVLGRTHSRRQADALIAAGRVTVERPQSSLDKDPANPEGLVVVSLGGSNVGRRVFPGDVVRLDGTVVNWELLWSGDAASEKERLSFDASNEPSGTATATGSDRHEYIKYWKPTGVTCTCDRRVPSNILEALEGGPRRHRNDAAFARRIFPVGRLDKDTTGLILLTSDGRVPNSVLQHRHRQAKTYEMLLDRPITDQHLDALREGVVITTESSSARAATSHDPSQSPYRRKALTARTLPAQVTCCDPSRRQISITIVEGRNRQVRKMLGALQYSVLALHRTHFMGLSLEGLTRPGDWKRLEDSEIELLQLRMTDRSHAGTQPPVSKELSQQPPEATFSGW